MVHIAYDSLEVLNNCPTKIDAVESYGPHLLVSCSDGSLHIYGPESFGYDQSPSSDCLSQILGLRKGPYVLERTVNCFSKKPIVAMEILVSRELLLSLSESIAFHSLPNLETIAVITKAKGANAYSWDDRRGFLCFAKQKRVCIFRHDGGLGFIEVKEFRIPDMVKSMSWCGENICLGLRREYTILNTTNGALSEVFPSGRIAPPLVVSLSSGELLLGKDNIGVFVDQNGKLLQEGRICWSEAPTTVVIQKPYAIALLSRHVEVRSLRVPHPLIQTIVLGNVRHLLQSNNVIIEALDNSVHGLFPVPLRAQIVQLTASGDFEEALVLCKLLPPEDSSLRTATEQSIHMRYAHHLFENGDYEEAMEHFMQSQVEITYVLSLYPSITLPKSSMVVETEKFMDITRGDASDLSRGSSCLSDDLEYLHPPPQKLESSGESSPSALESKKMSHNTLMAVIKFLRKKRFSIVDKATAEKTEEVVSDALGHHFVTHETNRPKKSTKGQVSIPVNWGAKEMVAILDTALLQGLLLTGQPLAALELLKGLNYCDIKICKDFLQKRSQYSCLLELYKCNDLHREALKLLHQLVEESRSDNKQHPEIIQKFKPEMILEYLKPLCGEYPDLVLEFSMLVLERCPPQTIELFLSGNIATDKVNTHLKQRAPNMQATYLELMLAMDEKGISGNLQNEMVQIYLLEVLEWHENLSSQKKWDEKAYSPPRKKLLSALERLSGYSPENLLKRLPQNALYEERAILLGKMNEHKLALCIYVHKLHVPELALLYCDRVYESGLYQHSSKIPGNIYLTLLDIYLNPQTTTTTFENQTTNQVSSSQNTSIPKVNSWTTIKTKRVSLSKKIAEIQGAEHTQTSPSSTDSGRSDADADDHPKEEASASMIDEALNLLSQRWDRIDGAQALKLLPGETTIQNLIPFLGPLMRKSSEAHRNFSVIKSLRESENLRVKDELYSQRKTVVKITGDSMCSRCNKKIGTSAFAVYPDGKTIVHFVCFRDSQNTKAVTQRSTLRSRR